MKSAVISSACLTEAGRRLDAPYGIALAEELAARGLPQTVGNARVAAQAIRDREASDRRRASELRDQARTLVDDARALEDGASLTFPARR